MLKHVVNGDRDAPGRDETPPQRLRRPDTTRPQNAVKRERHDCQRERCTGLRVVRLDEQRYREDDESNADSRCT